MELRDLQLEIRAFAHDRDWEQFHTIRNLILALVGEVGELAESVQWLNEIDAEYLSKHPDKKFELKEELADILIYLLRLADVSDIDLIAAAKEKMAKNSHRYTVEKSKGNAEKQ